MKTKYIHVSAELHNELRKIFKVSRMTLWRALHFRNDSELSRKIRNVALMKGGRELEIVEFVDGFMPNCQTSFTHDANGVQLMILHFKNGVRLVIDDFSAKLYAAEEHEAGHRYEMVTAADMARVVFEAEALSQMPTA